MGSLYDFIVSRYVDISTGEIVGYALRNGVNIAVMTDGFLESQGLDKGYLGLLDLPVVSVVHHEGRFAVEDRISCHFEDYDDVPFTVLGDSYVVYGNVVKKHYFVPLDNEDAFKNMLCSYEDNLDVVV